MTVNMEWRVRHHDEMKTQTGFVVVNMIHLIKNARVHCITSQMVKKIYQHY